MSYESTKIFYESKTAATKKEKKRRKIDTTTLHITHVVRSSFWLAQISITICKPTYKQLFKFLPVSSRLHAGLTNN